MASTSWQDDGTRILYSGDLVNFMQIASISGGFPSLLVTNDDLLEQIRITNRSVAADEVERYCGEIAQRLEHAGANTRYYRDREKGETAFPILMGVVGTALEKAEMRANEIDLLIYCGVGRGFAEPAMSYFVAAELGIACHCFDVVDACMSWTRAVYLVYNLFARGAYSKALIVNAEFNVYESGYPELTTIDGQLHWDCTFPAFTIGEAASATVLLASDSAWSFRFRSLPENVGLCTIPLKNHGNFSPAGMDSLARNGVGNFMCLGTELSARGRKELLRFITDSYVDPTIFDRWFPHTATKNPYRRLATALGVADKFYTRTFPQYGNLVSASIPVALATAAEEGDLRRGEHIVLCPVSAGMSLALVDFTY